MRSRACVCAFTLLELLVVVSIVAFLAGMIAFLPSGDRRDADVRAAAEELAATLRSARSLAMRQVSIVGVAFNIRNGVGTSGKVLNNRDGGHWYRIIGPNGVAQGSFGDGTFSLSAYPRADNFSGYSITSFTQTPAGFLRAVAESWAGDRHVLPPRRVRFLALSDQDNGTVVDPPSSQAFPATYPRPWFGYWEAGRLHPWGGYDHALVDARGQRSSGFCYEGKDGEITGSVNPVDRFTTWEGGGPGQHQIFAAGKGRALVNANWLDYVIRFYPDGNVDEGPIMEARVNSFGCRGPAGSSACGGVEPHGDLGDLCGWSAGAKHDRWFHTPMTSYAKHTGFYAITLCPDIDQDTDRFPSAREALQSMWPAYRVTVGRNGFVQVVKLSATQPAGTTWDTTITAADWQTPATTRVFYQHCVATGADRQPRGMPVTGFLTPELLASRNWWRTVP